MPDFQLSARISCRIFSDNSPCARYARDELVGLLGRLSVTVEVVEHDTESDRFMVQLGTCDAPALPALPDDRPDAFQTDVQPAGIVLSARSAKGLLNAVYDLVERLGVTFLLPGDQGTWVPEGPATLPCGLVRSVPRFAHRGVFWQSLKTLDYSVEQWLTFYARLRFNTVAHKADDRELAEKLGMRLEAGGHGLSSLLPRDRFDDNPELFRMFQPEDFNGRRQPDSNLCVTHPEAVRIVKENYAARLDASPGVYAEHAWADDLPAGGWCLCPACRAFSPSDQAQLAMNHLAEVVHTRGDARRVPVLAYHDTMHPGREVPPAPQCVLLFAPRERCYGHALDDPSCRRNRFYLDALEQWTAAFDGIDDAHTFEYYFDQILFRGIYPYLPEVILGDMDTYHRHGIETHLSLQVGGPAIAPEYNMLIFARAHWDEELTAERFADWLSPRLCPQQPELFKHYLDRRAELYQRALWMCEFDPAVYLDYRWLPESSGSFGPELTRRYTEAAEGLRQAAEQLEADVPENDPKLVELVGREARRARFEAAEFDVMHHQMDAVSAFGRYQAGRSDEDRQRGIDSMQRALELLGRVRRKADEAGLPEGSWYYRNINAWLAREFRWKIKLYSHASVPSRTDPTE